MKHRLFRGGVHPEGGKELTSEKAIVSFSPGGIHVFPLAQHIGSPCLPLVEKGQEVLRGQLIASPPEGRMGVSIHSSVSGTVKAVEVRPLIGGRGPSIVVESDGQAREVPFEERPLWRELSRAEILSLVGSSGIVGLGGACFPTSVKLNPPPDSPIDTVILNGAECEPYLTCDDRIMREHADEIAQGTELLRHLFPEASVVVGLEENTPEAIEALRRAFEASGGVAEVRALPVMYPQGSEKQLIYAVTGRAVPSGKLPCAVGCLVQNVATVRNMYLAVAKGRPLMDRVITVTGEAFVSPGNFLVPLGTLVSQLVEAAGGFREEPGKVIAGGPMMGVALTRLDVPVVKGTSGLLAQPKSMTLTEPEQDCIRCGRCIEVCPMGLAPNHLNRLALLEDYDAFVDEGGMDCIECGSCSYTCPAMRYLVQSLREAKRTAGARRRK